jgi:hypothetical protein
LDAWAAEDFGSMYAMLATVNRDAVTQEEFTNRYLETATQPDPHRPENRDSLHPHQTHQRQMAYRATYITSLMGEISPAK